MENNFNELNKNLAEYTYIIQTYGCQMNNHDSEAIKAYLENLGCKNVISENSADIIIINTCCIRDTAEQKILSHLGRLKHLKSLNPNLIIVICGCLPQQKGKLEKLRNSFPFVDIIIGTHNINLIYEYLLIRINNNKRSYKIYNEPIFDVPNREYYRTNKTVASVNIMYGCNNFCSYCIVPFVRGRERSRSINEIINEINDLSKSNYKEVLLLGQNVNSYNDNSISFSNLLQRICEETNISRIRFMTSHPKDFSDSLIETINNYPQICKQIHLPVQSGSTKILKKMNRKYSRDEYLNLIAKIRSKIPSISLSTDLIIGFPGENDNDFEQTLSLIKEVEFDSAFTFIYSKRIGTFAANMPNQVPKQISRSRIIELINLQNIITSNINKNYVGKIVNVLAESLSKRNNNHICGRTDTGKTVNFVGNLTDIGNFCKVKIIESKKTTLFGVKI